jgi:hypothetical protein
MLLGVLLNCLALLGTENSTMDERSSTRAEKLAIHNTRGAGARYFQQKKKLDIRKIRRRPLKHKAADIHPAFMYLSIGSSPSPLLRLRRSSV